ncbi:MAG: hypothetical protein JNK23_01745 [Opitutaceae bacterium]|nr:hypothetical protein [Opitutaceae bacterium]
MQSALTVFWILSGLGFAAGIIVTVVGLIRAPEGFEDESGFHHAESSASRKAKLANAGHAVRPSQPELA